MYIKKQGEAPIQPEQGCFFRPAAGNADGVPGVGKEERTARHVRAALYVCISVVVSEPSRMDFNS